MTKLIIAASFAEDMEQIYSPQLEERVYRMVESLAEYPELGTVDCRKSIKTRFGGTVRKLVVGVFDIFYRYDVKANEVRVLALMNQRGVY